MPCGSGRAPVLVLNAGTQPKPASAPQWPQDWLSVGHVTPSEQWQHEQFAETLEQEQNCFQWTCIWEDRGWGCEAIATTWAEHGIWEGSPQRWKQSWETERRKYEVSFFESQTCQIVLSSYGSASSILIVEHLIWSPLSPWVQSHKPINSFFYEQGYDLLFFNCKKQWIHLPLQSWDFLRWSRIKETDREMTLPPSQGHPGEKTMGKWAQEGEDGEGLWGGVPP